MPSGGKKVSKKLKRVSSQSDAQPPSSSTVVTTPTSFRSPSRSRVPTTSKVCQSILDTLLCPSPSTCTVPGTKAQSAASSARSRFALATGRLTHFDQKLFSGDYQQWPTFRDLFTANYINNARLTPVEKLYHLNQKTSGEAHDIVAQAPLTNDGFDSAWNNLPALKELHRSVHKCLTTLQHSEVSTDSCFADGVLVYLITDKLPKATVKLWEQSVPNKFEVPTWRAMNKFLGERYLSLEATEDGHPGIETHYNSRTSLPTPAPRRVNSFEGRISSKARTCDLCSRSYHPVRSCPEFLRLTVQERSSYIQQKQLCLNCFARGHQLWDCTSAYNCSTCNGRHHTLLHRGEQTPSGSNCAPSPHTTQAPTTIQSTSSSLPSSNDSAHVQSYCSTNVHQVLLGTAIVDICHAGTRYKARALIDSGFEATSITERIFKIIRLPFQAVQAQVSGLSQTVAAKDQKLCHFTIGSALRPGLQVETTAYVLPQLAGNFPSYPVPQKYMTDLPKLQLADPCFHRSSQIDVLIGADILPSIVLSGFRSNICGSLLGQETIFGWVLSGPVAADSSRMISSFTTKISVSSDVRLEKLLTRFWEVEDLPGRPTSESDSICEDNFLQTTQRAPDGRYIVSLPFKCPEKIDLGYSRLSAHAQFLRNEQRLQRNLPLKEQYDAVIHEYLELGHMKQVPPSHDSGHFYLPHHAVFKPESVQPVFERKKPWRVFRYVFNADINKMYRQILVAPQHTPYQRIIFRNPSGDVCDYELDTVTFGVSCAPFLAIRVLRQLAHEVRPRFPKASDILANYMYVDDVLAGTHTQPQAIFAIAELREALDSAGFPLRKWTANQKGVLSDIPLDHLLRADFLELEESSIAKTLGIRWQASADEFFFVPPELIHREACTKRNVLSQIAKLFDPAGWLAPFVIQAKMFMQEVWLRELGWDDDLPGDLRQTWETFLQSFPAIQQIHIPRGIHVCPTAKVQIHGFCDASQRAYGAAIYVRVERPHGIFCSLLTAKTRVAPVKTISLPRLELCGAVLLAELSAAILPEMPLDTSQVSFWTDSTIVLAWLHKLACEWTTFVGNRVATIAR
ncbi:uncharacterized protein LOC121404571 [Drosophila obscura]|uniref:uncharacterized protein LOC121404571 n=1 Tax=Drosophila obscura TaxID=7282 RepID=UPI001BB1017F|nr:uncharacterized protein LOC121404571 [Drosophila obscura]